MHDLAAPPAFAFEPHRDVPSLFEPFARFAKQTDVRGQLLLDECALELDSARAVMVLAKNYISHVGRTAESTADIMPLRDVAIARQKGEPDPVGASTTNAQPHVSADRER